MLDVVTAKAGVARSLGDFFRLHSARAHLDGTTRHSDVFSHPRCRAFLVDVCERFAEHGALRIFRLNVGGGVVATRVGFVLGGTLYLYYSGFDPRYARYGIMTTTVAEAMQYAIGEGLDRVNLSSGKDVSKTRWRPEELAYREVTLTPMSSVARAKYEAALVAQRVILGAGIEGVFARRQAAFGGGRAPLTSG